MGRGQRSGYRHSQQVILSPCLVGRNTRMYTRNFAFRSFCNVSDHGRLRELIDEVTTLIDVREWYFVHGV